MKLSKYMVRHLEAKLDEYFEKEKVDPKLFPAENYNSCFDRAMDWLQRSFDESKDMMATEAGYAIAIDREKSAGENTMDEQASLLDAGADPEVGTMAFWSE